MIELIINIDNEIINLKKNIYNCPLFFIVDDIFEDFKQSNSINIQLTKIINILRNNLNNSNKTLNIISRNHNNKYCSIYTSKSLYTNINFKLVPKNEKFDFALAFYFIEDEIKRTKLQTRPIVITLINNFIGDDYLDNAFHLSNTLRQIDFAPKKITLKFGQYIENHYFIYASNNKNNKFSVNQFFLSEIINTAFEGQVKDKDFEVPNEISLLPLPPAKEQFYNPI